MPTNFNIIGNQNKEIDSIFKITLIDEKMVLLWDIGYNCLITIAKRDEKIELPIADYIKNNHKVGDTVKLKIFLERLHKEEDVKI